MRPEALGSGARRGSLRTQLVVLTSAVTLLGVVALTVVVQIVLARSTASSLDRVLEDRTETVISSALVSPDGRLSVPDERLDAGVAVYDDDGRLIAGSVPTAVGSIYADLATVTTRQTEVRSGDDESRVLAQPFTVDGAAGVVVVTERLAPYERAEQQALLVCVGAGVLMVLLAAGLALWVSRRALAPVVAMTRAADEWSEHDLAHRFELGGNDEIAALGRTLDRLLERVASAIRAEQRLTSEMAHELRTPLTAIQTSTDLALMQDVPRHVRETLDEVALATRRMGVAIDSLLELARSESSQALGRSCLLGDAIAEVVSTLDARAVEVSIVDVRVLLPISLAVRALAPVIDNAQRVSSRVVISAGPSRTGYVDLFIDDDGPGIPTGEHERIFEPGSTSGEGAGLGLALARRVARSMGGDVRVGEGPLVTRFVITLPLA